LLLSVVCRDALDLAVVGDVERFDAVWYVLAEHGGRVKVFEPDTGCVTVDRLS
jgi:hypothetical protein